MEDADQAAEISALVDDVVEVGQLVEMDTCVQEWELELYRNPRHKPQPQPCPRPGLSMDPANALAWEYMQRSMSEFTRHGAEPILVDAGCGPAERLAIRRRVAVVLSDRDVSALLFPEPGKDDEKKPEGDPSDAADGEDAAD